LRNHDELTLEMVTDEERDYMYRVYAEDPQARINLGIRRRLAPLLGNDRRRIEMMNVLLCALPGTPVLYYGDEIGMGDNVYLGDRNGVRTPMQWNADRNAGFSQANPQRLYLPIVADPEYQPGAINVEAQHNNPHSLLWWMRHLIAARRRSPALATGDLQFLFPENRKVLVFLRTLGDERILVIVNLARSAQFVELDLSRFAGMVPVEMFGSSEFPKIGDLPYFVTLGPYGYYWFRLEEPPDGAAEADDPTPPSLRASGSWMDLLKADGIDGAVARLGPYLRRQRWFGGKDRRIVSVTAADIIPIEERAVLTLITVQSSEGDPQTYVLPVTGRPVGDEPRPPAFATIATVDAEDGSWFLTDGLFEGAVAARLLEAIERRRTIRGSRGRLVATRTDRFAELRGDASEPLEVRTVGADHTNTSLAYGDRLMLKVFRRPERGENPDLEISRFLTTRSDFPNTPAVAGSIEYRPSEGPSRTIATLQAFVPNEGDAWQLTLDALRGAFEEALARHPDEPFEEPTGHVLDLAAADASGSAAAAELVGPYLEVVRLLGRRTAELHMALASGRDPAFAPEPFAGMVQRAMLQSIRTQIIRTFRRLRAAPGDGEIARLLDREEDLVHVVATLLGPSIRAQRIRVHGDYHLAQVLWTGRDFAIIDFEGEPARPLTERRIKRSPLRDVAGMLRSFDYASWTALGSATAEGVVADSATLEPWARRWTRWVSGAFLAAYVVRAREGGAAFLPIDDDQLRRLLDALRIEKAAYEVGYELDHRPDLVGIPVRGLLGLLDEVEGP
jgi:maltose alpha-D-glucosyltransferase/alpha-amylase